MTDPLQKARTVKGKYETRWLKIRGVNAVGIGQVKNEICIIVSVTGHLEDVQQEIPLCIEGVPVNVKLSGEFEAY